MNLRPYQIAAIESVLAMWRKGAKRLLVQMATGTGKTVLFAELAKRCKGNVLIVNERQELVEQTASRVAEWTGAPVGIEMGDRRDLSRGPRPRVVVASIQTLAKRFTAVPFNWPTFIVIDEAHHAVAKSYRDVLDYFSGSYILGVTATPDRSDEIFLGQTFEELAFQYSIAHAIRDGWLAPIRQFAIKTTIDLSRVRTTAGDLNAGDLEAVMVHEANLAQVARPIVSESKGKPGIVFGVSVRHAHDLAAALNSISGSPNFAAALDGSHSRDERAAVLDAARRGDIKMLCNCALFTEGFDWPAIEVVAVARPTKSRALYAQMVGRGTRLSPGKTDVLVLDFTSNSKKHRLVRAIDIYEGQIAEDELEIINEIADEQAEPVTLEQLMVLSAERLRQRAEEIRYEMLRADPFAAALIGKNFGAPAPERPTEAQVKALLGHGIQPQTISAITRGLAETLVASLELRKTMGLATAPQARLLRRYGIDATNVTKADASKIIAHARAGGFRPSVVKSAAAQFIGKEVG